MEEDRPKCEEVYEEKCETKTQGYSTTEECSKWPITKCTLETTTVKKYTPETDCKKTPFQLCGPSGCPVEPGPEQCFDKTETVSENSSNLQQNSQFHRIHKNTKFTISQNSQIHRIHKFTYHISQIHRIHKNKEFTNLQNSQIHRSHRSHKVTESTDFTELWTKNSKYVQIVQIFLNCPNVSKLLAQLD